MAAVQVRKGIEGVRTPCTLLKAGAILKSMAPLEPSGKDIRLQLEKLLASPGFRRNDRASDFLRFVCDRALAGEHRELKETVIAIEVFGRKPDYDPKRDAIVRTEAGRLRSRLSEYYIGEGASDAIVIDLPKGGYVPFFRLREASSAAGASLMPKRSWIAVVTLAAMALMAAGVVFVRWLHAPLTIAVLPFENLSHDPEAGSLADSLTGDLIGNLSRYEEVTTRSRGSSFAWKGKERDTRAAGRDLAAEYLVEGSVRRDGDLVRVNVDLVRTRDDSTIWSAKFTGEASTDFDEDITRGILAGLPLKSPARRKYGSVNPEALALYRKGLRLGLQDGVFALEEAIVKDPSFPSAYARLAAAYAYRTGSPSNDTAGELPRMREVAEKGVVLSPRSGEALSALAISYARDGQWKQSEKTFRRAIQMEPQRPETYGEFATYVLMQEGRISEALDLMLAAQKSGPLSPEARSMFSYVLLASHRYGDAAQICEEIPPDCRCWPAPAERVRNECIGRARLGQDRIAEAIDLFAAGARQTPRGAPIRGYLAYAYALVGRREEAEKIAASDWNYPYHQALAYMGLGDRNRTFQALDRMAASGPVRVGLALAVPELDAIRNDPRERALRRKLALPD